MKSANHFSDRSRIALAVLFLSCLTCFGQFGVEQPFFLTSSTSSEIQPTVSGLGYWWVASDLPTNTIVTNWVDRINGLVFKNDNTSDRPTNSVQGIGFDGSSELTNTGFCPSFTNGFFIIIKRSVQGAWNPIDLSYTFRSYSVYNCDLVGIQSPTILWAGANRTLPTNSWITLGWTYTTNTARYYTNGVFTGTAPLIANLTAGTLAARRLLGGQGNGSIYFTGFVREYLGFTNRLTDDDMTNLHYYATTKYASSWP